MLTTEPIERANYSALAASEREKAVWFRTLLILAVVIQPVTAVAALYVATTWFNPYVRLDRRGMLSTDPTAYERIFVAWEAARGPMMVSPDVATQLEISKSWMTNAAAEELEKALSAYQRKYRVSYIDDVIAQGVTTHWDDLEWEVEEPVGSGASKRYPVLIKGRKTKLNRRDEPVSDLPFAIRVWLVRVTESEENPMGIAAAGFEVPDGVAGDNDVTAIVQRQTSEEEQ